MDTTIYGTGKPLQVIPYAEKTPKWFAQNGEYFIAKSNFNFGTKIESGGRKDLRVFYEVYNNMFPLEWFDHITNPLSAVDEINKAYPAKIRPVSILRTNIDLLWGEYLRRPFIYNVENLGETGYNQYMEDLTNRVHKNLQDHFIQFALKELQDSGQPIDEKQMEQLQKNPPLPEKIKEEFEATYRDAIAIKAQKWLRKTIREYGIKKKYHKMFFDWLISGYCFSYKGISNGKLVYKKVSPLSIDYDKSIEKDLIEDGEWVVERRLLTPSDVVDEFYSVLKEQEVKDLDSKYLWDTPDAFYTSLQGLYSDHGYENKIPVFKVQWQGKKCVKILSYTDPETFQLIETEVDEEFDEKSIPGAKAKKEWRNEVYEVDRVGKDLYINGQATHCQRNGEVSKSTKLSYNGKAHSDTHATNISVLELGLPFQIMVIIITYIIEKTIAKSKGKILMVDANAIPTGEGKEGWDEERTFYYAEATGYMLIDRNQFGVDKSWNQYHAVDLSLFDQIKQLIELKNSFKQEWDELIGINRQRKGQTYASDAVGNNERAAFQSTVITDMIFSGFEEFVQAELQGLMDLGKYLTANGLNSVYQDDEFGTMLLEVAPEEFSNADLGVFIDDSAEHIRKLQTMSQMATAMLQNNAKPSTMMEIIDSLNAAELKTKLKRIETIEQEIAAQTSESEQAHQQELEQIAQRHAEYLELLKRDTMEAEYNRKEDLEHIKGGYSTFKNIEGDGDNNNDGVPDAIEMQKIELQRQNMELKKQNAKDAREKDAADRLLKIAALKQKMETDKKNLNKTIKK